MDISFRWQLTPGVIVFIVILLMVFMNIAYTVMAIVGRWVTERAVPIFLSTLAFSKDLDSDTRTTAQYFFVFSVLLTAGLFLLLLAQKDAIFSTP